MPGRRAPIACSGRMWFNKAENHFLGPNRVALLESIAELGSISKAAKALGMSYKAAWDSIEAMNRLSEEPLVIRISGGRGGGGTNVTPHGSRLIAAFRMTEESFRQFLTHLNEQLAKDLGIRPGSLPSPRTDVPNRLEGRVARFGRVGDEVKVGIALDAGGEISTVFSGTAATGRQLKDGSRVVVLIRPTAVLLLPEQGYANVVGANSLPGEVAQITEGGVSSRIQVRLDAGWVITAVQILGSARNPGVSPGERVLAVFRPTDVLLAIPNAEP